MRDLTYALILLLFASCNPLPPEDGSEERPNVLFIIVDDLRPQLACYGADGIVSPNIDQLAREGVRFTRSYCQVPVCGASRASFLTGLRPTRKRFTSFKSVADEDAPGITGLPKHFKECGYHTISNGKVFHHYEKDGAGGWSETPWHPNGWVEAPWYPKGNWANYLMEENLLLRDEFTYGHAFESPDVPDNAYFDGAIAEKTIADLQHVDETEKPFFIVSGFRKPHLPFNAPKKYWDMYERSEIDLAANPFIPENAPEASLTYLWELNNYVGIPKAPPVPDSLARTLIHGYNACVSYIDAQVGKILAELDSLGLRDNTIVLLIGDHGWHLGEHGFWSKFTNFEEALKAPMIVSAPGLTGGKASPGLVEFVDLYPTLCELCDLPNPEHLEGTSLVPLLEDPDSQWDEAAFSRFRDGESVKTDRYRYTEWTDDKGEVYARMLYDHLVDPDENMNIVMLPENEQVVEEMSNLLHSAQQ